MSVWEANGAGWLNICSGFAEMRRAILISFGSVALAAQAFAQHTVDVPQQEKDKAQRQVAKQQEKKAQHTSIIEFQGAHAFDEKEQADGGLIYDGLLVLGREI